MVRFYSGTNISFGKMSIVKNWGNSTSKSGKWQKRNKNCPKFEKNCFIQHFDAVCFLSCVSYYNDVTKVLD